MSRIQSLLRVLIIAGALASVLHVNGQSYTLTRLQLVMHNGFGSGMTAPNSHEILRLALTAISLSLL